MKPYLDANIAALH